MVAHMLVAVTTRGTEPRDLMLASPEALLPVQVKIEACKEGQSVSSLERPGQGWHF